MSLERAYPKFFLKFDFLFLLFLMIEASRLCGGDSKCLGQ